MNIAIILAAGTSTRFQQSNKQGKDKLLMPILGKPLLYYSLQTFHDHPLVQQVFIAVNKENRAAVSAMIKQYHFPRVKKIILGGTTRQGSLERVMKELSTANPSDIILVHNAANPLVTEKEISEVINAAQKYKAAAVGHNVVDTIKHIHKGYWVKTHNRDTLRAAQTPQAARFDILKKSLQKAKKTKATFTDESSLLENSGYTTKHISASPNNYKITTWQDYERAKVLLGDVPQNFLVGIGQDSHEFEKSKKGLTLAGIKFSDYPKLSADSDGDVILHALYNAISQALGDGSLGRFATPLLQEKGITDSGHYLKNVLQKLKKRGYIFNNLGLMIEAKIPKIDPIVPQLKKSLSNLIGLPQRSIGITATSGDGLTAFGQGKGIQCFAIVSLKKDEN